MTTAGTNLQPVHTLEHAEAPGSMITNTAAKSLAVLRIATGFVFLWAFLDKTFGLGYSTSSAKAWIHGGSPTKGFLSSIDVGPFQSAYHSMAGTWWADWLFMLGMLSVGVALIAGIALRLAAGAGVLIMAMMWLGESPWRSTPAPAHHPRRPIRSPTTTSSTPWCLLFSPPRTPGTGGVWAGSGRDCRSCRATVG